MSGYVDMGKDDAAWAEAEEVWTAKLADLAGRRLDHDVFAGTPHEHRERVAGCFRCDLSSEEAALDN